MRDRRATVGVMMAIGSLALFPMLGLAVDGARLMFARERLIGALDAAALAGGRVINSTAVINNMPQYQNDAIAYYNMNFPAKRLGVVQAADPQVSVSPDGTEITVSQTINVQMMFGAFVGHPDPVPISFSSTAYAGKVEVAMALDVSNSMNQSAGANEPSKIALVQQAATSFVTALTSLGNNNVRIAIVPFAATVNVGTQYARASWTDGTAGYIYKSNYRNGLTSPAQPFLDTFTDGQGNNHQTDRWALFDNLKISGQTPQNSPWAGCLEMRPAVYDTNTGQVTRYDVNDYPVDTSNPASMFVPLFSPSQPDVTYKIKFAYAKSWQDNSWQYVNPYTNNIYLKDMSSDNKLDVKPYDGNDVNSYSSNLSHVRIQEGDYTKYVSSNITSSSWQISGPNATCLYSLSNPDGTVTAQPLEAVTRLTADTGALDTAISHLRTSQSSSDHGTDLDIGTFWAWEMISPNSAFKDTQSGYDNLDYKKYIIILTDGCNDISSNNFDNYDAYIQDPWITASIGYCKSRNKYYFVSGLTDYNYSMPAPVNVFDYDISQYTSSGYPWQNRLPFGNADDMYHLSEKTLRDAMDSSFNAICTNMKAEGIQIYTIGIGTSGANNPALQACASDLQHYFPLSDPTSLSSVFLEIASQLTTVRLVAKSPH